MAEVTHKTLCPVIIRTARAALGWSASKLAEESGLTGRTLRTFEAGGTVSEETRIAVFSTLKAAKVVRSGNTLGLRLFNGGEPGARLVRIKDSE